MNLSAYMVFTQSGVSSGSTPKGCIDDGIDHNRHKQVESLNSNRKRSMHGSLSVAVQVSFTSNPLRRGQLGIRSWWVCGDLSWFIIPVCERRQNAWGTGMPRRLCFRCCWGSMQDFPLDHNLIWSAPILWGVSCLGPQGILEGACSCSCITKWCRVSSVGQLPLLLWPLWRSWAHHFTRSLLWSSYQDVSSLAPIMVAIKVFHVSRVLPFHVVEHL